MNDASLEQLPESLRANEGLKSVEDFPQMAEKFLKQGETITTLEGEREGMVAIPKDDASEDQRSVFFKAAGRPDAPEGYEITKPEMKEGDQYDESFEKLMRESGHEVGLSKKQLSHMNGKVLDYYSNMMAEANKNISDYKTSQVEGLKKDWGADFEKNTQMTYDAISMFAEKEGVLEGIGGKEELQKWLKVTGMDTDPIFNRFFFKMFNVIGGDEYRGGGQGGNNDKTGPKVFSSYKNMK